MSGRAGSRLRSAAAALLLCAAGVTCNSGQTGPNVPVSIEFLPPQLPSMIVNDQLHDTLGNIDSLRAIVFNSSGDTIHGAPIRFIHADTSHKVDIDSITGHVMTHDTGFARVVAQASTLQSLPETLFVVLTPTSFTPGTPLEDTLVFSPVRTDTLFPLSVILQSGTNPVNRFRIEYRFVYPAALNVADSTQILLTDANRKFSLVDTTGSGANPVSGTATRYLRITPFTHFTTDTVVVEARAFLPNHTPVPGSPLRFKVLVQIQ